MRYGVFVEITGGKNHDDLCEDRCENYHPRWNASFQLDGQDEPYCIASDIVTLVKPEKKIFLPAVVESIRCKQRAKMTQLETEEWTPDCMPDCTIWRLGGRPNCWPSELDEDAIVFVEYDAIEQHGYALIITNFVNISAFWRVFPCAIISFSITKEEEDMLCAKW